MNNVNAKLDSISIVRYGKYDVYLTRREALRALFKGVVRLRGHRVCPVLAFGIGTAKISVGVWGAGGGGGGSVNGYTTGGGEDHGPDQEDGQHHDAGRDQVHEPPRGGDQGGARDSEAGTGGNQGTEAPG